MREASRSARAGAASGTLDDLLRDGARALLRGGIADGPSDARRLAAGVLGLAPAGLIACGGEPLAPSARAALEAALARRAAREPVARIIGRRAFWTLELALGPAVLDPRPESETLVEAALALADAEGGRQRPLRILDIGTGSGALLLAMLSELPNATGVGSDISAEALAIAARNARSVGLSERARFVRADATAGLTGPFDLLLANPPYIASADIEALEPEVRLHDPRVALDGGCDGLDVYRKICAGARALVPDGWVLLEVGCGQSEAVARLLAATRVLAPGTQTVAWRDLAGIARVVAARTQNYP